MSLPLFMHSLIGPIPVHQSHQIDKQMRREGTLGDFNWADRTIRVRTDMPIEMQVKVLGHELAHSVLYDSGVHRMLTEKQEEAICDAFGTWFQSAISSGKLVLK